MIQGVWTSGRTTPMSLLPFLPYSALPFGFFLVIRELHAIRPNLFIIQVARIRSLLSFQGMRKHVAGVFWRIVDLRAYSYPTFRHPLLG
jgi:hypothetical protein